MGIVHSQIIPSFGNKSEFKVAEEYLSLVKGQNSWKEETGKEKSAPCQLCPDRSLPGEDTFGSSESGNGASYTIYGVYPKGT